MDLQGKVALITGGKRIGAVVAEHLAARGVDVALTYARSKTDAEATAAAVTKLGRRSLTLAADLADPEACAAVVTAAAAALGRLDILINMASVYLQKPLDDTTLADWDAPMQIDLRASYLCARAAIPFMRQQGGGRIVNFADWVVASGRPRYRGYLPYYVAKAGVKALTEALALELAGVQILVNAVAPGPILAPPELTADEIKAVEEATPLGRWGGEREIARAVLGFLESDFVTGETIRVDGGRHLR